MKKKSQIDTMIADLKGKLRNNSVPMRMRDKRVKSRDGYPEYVTQAEVDANRMLNETYEEGIRNLEMLKKFIGEGT
jgi:hypothetical protein